MGDGGHGVKAASGPATAAERPDGTGTPDPRRWYALGLLCLASFLVILDAQIVTIAVPALGRELGFAGAGVQWVLTAYVVTFGGLLLFGGRLADLLGRRRVFVAGVGLFIVASLLCGLAWTGGALVGFRVVQGIAAAVMTPTAMSIVLTTFPGGPERNVAIGVWSAIAGIGASAGALVGGPLTDGLGWQWIFLINVPIGVAIMVLAPIVLRESYGTASGRGLDVAGAVTSTAALMLFLFGVSEVPKVGLAGPSVLAPVAAAAVLLAVFVRVEQRSRAPLLPMRLLRSRRLVGGNLVQLAAGMAAFGQGFLLTQYAQVGLGWSAVTFGLATVVLPVAAVVGSMVGQRLVGRLGARVVAAVSTGLMGLACLLWTSLDVDSSYAAGMLPGMLVFGTGLGAGGVAASIAAMSDVEPADSGIASGLTNAAFQVGGALGVAVLSTVAASAGGAVASEVGTAFGVAAGFAAFGLVVALCTLGRAGAQSAS